ncbi:MAG: RHS repeat protein, partial [Candidatus Eremiobacteraeota bacterium]|nr:RHS repeat protein [Candidatus Eremiobacteraeota bacterium]
MSNSNPFAGPVDLDGYQRISGTCSDYDEIKLVNGGLVRTVSLIQVATNGARSLEFYLTYDAQSSLAPSSVGANWVHNYGASLTGLGTGVVTATLESGIPYHFIQEGSSDRYTLDTSTSSFIKANLTKQPGRWLLNFYPNGGYYQFDPNGVLQQMVDAHGNSLNLSYTGGKLSSVTESAGGRQITFGYTGSNLDSVTDPNGRTYVLQQDGSGNLTAVISTEGCMLLYGYANPASHLLTSRTDPNNNTYTYSYDGSRRLTQIADPLNNLLNYSYDTPQERVGDTGTINLPIFRTILVDARGNRWEYHFDTGGNLWRVIDPLHHWRRYYWTAEQNLIYSCSGHSQCEPIAAGTVGGPRDNTYNSFLRNVYDPRGNLLSTINSVGRVDQYEYDAGNRLISDFAGQGDIAVGGNWVGQYGEDGYLLCAWDSAGTDLAQLPDYISSITPTGVTKTNYNNFAVLTDPRALVGPDPAQSTEATRRGVGLWRNQGTPSSPGSFVVNLATSQAKSFNLSIYSHALDQSKPAWGILGPYQVAPSGGLYYQPLSYSEQFGCYLNYTVTDAKGTQNFVVYNNAPGMWATFPVTTTPEVPGVTITVTAVFNPDSGGVGTVQAQISALAFDPYSSRKIQRSYASSVYGQAVFGSDSYGSDGDLTQIVGPLGQKTSLTYNMDGTVATSTDSLGNTTRYFYGDSAKNLTSVVDPSGATWTMTYDNNGNLLTSENPNHHTTTMVYDGKNRLIRTTDALGNVTRLTYDPAGNLSSITDALDRTTLFDYTECNRLLRITDPLLGQTVYEYDPSGNLVAVTDPRGNRAQLVYDAAGRMIATIGADSQVVQYALDAQDRLVAVTTPNGTQSRLSSINTVNGGNWVRNASFEVRDPIVSSYNKAQFWQNLQGSVARDATHAHTGTYSQPFSLSAGVSQTLVQPSLALPPGGTFLANCWVEKAADGQAATINLSASLYDLQHAVQNLAGASTTLDGSQLTWQTLDLPWRLSVPGDSMATTFSTTRLALTASSSASTQVWVDDVSLTPLSTTYSYDQSGNVEEIRHPDGSRQRFYRDRWSRVVATEDARGNKTLTAYDDLDRIIALTDSLGYQTVFGYDANSNLISVTNAATTRVGTYGSARYGLNAYVGPGQEMQFFYNSRNLLSVMRYQDGTNEVFEYDPAGNLASYQDNQGRTRTFLYDDLERLTQVTYADATQVVFTYDAVSNVLTRLERNGDQTAFVHDALNRVVDEVRTLGGAAGVGWNHAQTFDAANNRTRFAFGASEYGSA